MKVYDVDTFQLMFPIQLSSIEYQIANIQSFNPYDVIASEDGNTLFVLDNRNSIVIKVALPMNSISGWKALYGNQYGLTTSIQSMSLTKDRCNILLTICYPSQLVEYTPSGRLLRKIEIQYCGKEGSYFCRGNSPTYGVQAEYDQFLVCHGGRLPTDLHQRVSLIGNSGQMIKSSGYYRGSEMERLNRPYYLAVDGNGFILVADYDNGRVVLLNSSLEFVNRFKCDSLELKHPFRMYFDEDQGRLYVSDYSNKRLVVFKVSCIFSF